ncbi:MAG: tetratricopeptide repeat protein [Chloroflexota bacterium]|nr:tetratricopeptide repeat protein [Chloroflexota bacterium]
MSSSMPYTVRQPERFTFGIHATTPPSTDPTMVLQRADEVNSVRRMLSNPQVSAVMITGAPGVGKSTLAALLYNRLQASVQAGKETVLAPRHFVWLSVSSFASLPDVIMAILTSLGVDTADFFLLPPEQQLVVLAQALCRPQEGAFIVLDQFESLLDPETSQGLVDRGALPAFFQMLQMDLGASRLLLTSYQSPYGSLNDEENRVRSYLVSRVSIPEGVALLQQRGLQGSYEELSLVWQRCGGHVFALILFCALFNLSKLSLSYLLNSPDYQPLWSGEVTLHMIDAVYRCLTPVQCIVLRALCLFGESPPLEGIVMTVAGDPAAPSTSLIEHEIGVLMQLSLVQQTRDEAGTYTHDLHSLLRHYMLEHYLAGNDVHTVGSQFMAAGALSSALGVSSPLNSVMETLESNDPESLAIALAAGHMQVASYYEYLAGHCPPRQQRSGLHDVAPLLNAIRHLCLGWHWQQACDLLFAEGLHESLLQWGTWNTLISLYMLMLPPSGVLTRRDEGLVSSHLGLLYARLGQYEESRACYENALAVQRTIGDQRDEAATLVNQGELLRNMGALPQARTCFEQALHINKQQQDPRIESAALHNLGLLYHAEKDYPRAMACYQQALSIAYELRERYNIGLIVTNMGLLLFEQGNPAEGLALLLFALQVRQTLQDPTAGVIETFLDVVAQRLGADAFARLRQAALDAQERVLPQLFPSPAVDL